MATSVIAGGGEVGQALCSVIQRRYPVKIVDPVIDTALPTGDVDVLHVCFPYSVSFEQAVRHYQDRMRPEFTVIHSTVPVGTSRKLGAFHSPVRGRHPKLAQSLIQFTKYLAPANPILKTYFEALDIHIECLETADASEALKLWDTAYLGWCVLFEKAVWEYCQQHKLPFDKVYTDANKTYNQGYSDLDMAQFVRPVLEHKPGLIGGHCVVPNLALLDSPLAELMLKLDK